MSSDIRPLGTGEGKGKYWIKVQPTMLSAGSLRLVLIDEHGQVEQTPLGAPWDDAAFTKDEAIQHHLRGAVAEADRILERRRREAPKPPPEPKPPPMDRPTRRFVDDDSVALDLTDWR